MGTIGTKGCARTSACADGQSGQHLKASLRLFVGGVLTKLVTTCPALLLTACHALLLTACTDKPTDDGGITVTIEPLAYLTERITQGTVPVHVLVPAGSSPETYEPTPRQMVDLAHSDLYIRVGRIGFETTWNDRLRANAPRTRFVDASQGIRYIDSSDGIADPHTWMSCTSARVMARNICRALTEQRPDRRTVYEQGLRQLLATIDSVDRAVGQRLSQSRQRAFVIYHPALTYFARDYHLLQLPMEEEGREPGAQQMQQLTTDARRHHVSTIFVQRQFSPRNTIALRRATGARTVEVNPLDRDWPAQMMLVADALAAAE